VVSRWSASRPERDLTQGLTGGRVAFRMKDDEDCVAYWGKGDVRAGQRAERPGAAMDPPRAQATPEGRALMAASAR